LDAKRPGEKIAVTGLAEADLPMKFIAVAGLAGAQRPLTISVGGFCL
jgi:hypothetical protein